ncbi:hypothetical protein CYY_006815 [Polysphondylium violaceum]|uniref:Uncharacterized protein n=1 Tax=Polysphondylium violaceum TaxID=133409 RepID=A0A8J4URA3_9MYCE|nr:hypothetical protein CYY_006815 [Polysphondylium violaceum]
MQLFDIVNTKSIPLLKYKINRFKSIIDNNNNNNDNDNDKNKFQYRDWIDLNTIESRDDEKSIQNIDLSHLHQEIQDFSQYLLNYHTKENEALKKDIVQKVIRDFNNDLNLCTTLSPMLRLGLNISKNMSTDVFRLLVDNGDIQILPSQYWTLLSPQHVTFFTNNRDYFRKIYGWNDKDFLKTLLEWQESPLDVDLLKWILLVSDRFNFDLYKQRNPVSQKKSALLLGCRVVLKRKPIFSNKSLFCNSEVFKFLADFYPDWLLGQIKNSTHFLQDLATAQLVIPFLQRVNFRNCFFRTCSQDLNLFKYLDQNQFPYDGPNILSNNENVDYLIKKNMAIFSNSFIFSQNYGVNVDPYSVLKRLISEKNYQDYSRPNSFSNAIKSGNFDYIKFIMQGKHYAAFGNNTWDYFIYLSYLHNETIFQYLLSHSFLLDQTSTQQQEPAPATSFYPNTSFFELICVALSKYDCKYLVWFFKQLTKEKQVEAVQKNIVPSYSYLAFAKKSQKKAAIENVEFLKAKYLEFGSPIEGMFGNLSWEFLFIQDPVFFNQLNLGPTIQKLYRVDKILLLKGAIVARNLSMVKIILNHLSVNGELDSSINLKSILLEYFMAASKSNVGFKVAIYLFEKYPDQFTCNTLDQLVSIAIQKELYILLDILLHRYAIRLIKPESPQHEYEMLKRAYYNLTLSQFKAKQKYLLLYPFTLESLDNDESPPTIVNVIIPKNKTPVAIPFNTDVISK